MSSEPQERLQSLMNAGESQNREASSELLERQVIDGTPFWIIGNKVDGYFLAFGKHRLGGVFNEKQDVLDYLSHDMWNIIGYLAGIIAEITYNDKEKNKDVVANVE